MTTAPADSTITLRNGRATGRPVARAGWAIGVHSVCDFFSFMAISLIPLLTATLELSGPEVALLLGVGSITSGVAQPAVAWISDRYDTRAVGTLGLLVAVVCISNIGHAQNFWQLLVLHGVGSAGIGAFHPPAAAAVGRLSGVKRSLGMAVFFLAGMIGGMGGNILTPQIVRYLSLTPDGTVATARGLAMLSWFVVPGVLACVLLALAIHAVPHRHDASHAHHSSLAPAEQRRRWKAVGVLYVTGVIRFSVNMALVYLFAQWAERWAMRKFAATELTETIGLEASQINGPLQAMMQVGMGGVGLVLGLLLGARHEKAAFVISPVFGALVIALIPQADRFDPGSAVLIAYLLSILAGVGFGSVIPISMSLAQRLLPHRTSLASGLMLGGAWAFAFVGPMAAQVIHTGIAEHELLHRVVDVDALPGVIVNGWGLDAAFYATACVLLLGGLIALRLPRALLVETAD